MGRGVEDGVKSQKGGGRKEKRLARNTQKERGRRRERRQGQRVGGGKQ